MEENKKESTVVIPKENRKMRRHKAAMKHQRGITKRSNQRNRLATNTNHWQKRFINEMKQNKSIQNKIMDGTFDKVLESKK